MRKLLFLLGIAALAGLLAACGDNPPPTQIYIVISPTPEPITPSPAESSPSPSETPAPTVTEAPTASAQPASTGVTPTAWLASATPQPELFPTNTVAEVQAVETIFQYGRMFWLRHNRQIWVMVNNPPDNSNSGDWFCYNDTFEEGEPEIDPALVPPDGLYQPRRGFGKLWRTHEDIKAAVGWATTPEFELTSNYTYIAGGYVENNVYLPGPGEHRLTTTQNESISFFEGDIRGDCRGGTWRKAQ